MGLILIMLKSNLPYLRLRFPPEESLALVAMNLHMFEQPPGGQFHVTKPSVKFSSTQEKSMLNFKNMGKVFIKVQRNSTWWSFSLNLCLIKLAPAVLSCRLLAELQYSKSSPTHSIHLTLSDFLLEKTAQT